MKRNGTDADGRPHYDSYRVIRNFVIDVSRQPPGNSATGIHWQVSQATSLHNILFIMSTASGNNHQGESSHVYRKRIMTEHFTRYLDGERKVNTVDAMVVMCA